MSAEYIALSLAGLVFVGALVAAAGLVVILIVARLRRKAPAAAPSIIAPTTEGDILHAALSQVQDVANRKAANLIADKLTSHKAGLIQADFSSALADPKAIPPA